MDRSTIPAPDPNQVIAFVVGLAPGLKGEGGDHIKVLLTQDKIYLGTFTFVPGYSDDPSEDVDDHVTPMQIIAVYDRNDAMVIYEKKVLRSKLTIGTHEMKLPPIERKRCERFLALVDHQRI